MDNNCFFVDGSALLGDIRRARIDLGINATAKLNLKKFSAYVPAGSSDEVGWLAARVLLLLRGYDGAH
jgi:hypothetical protein